MESFAKVALCLLFFIHTCQGQRISFGRCPRTSVVPNLDVTKYLGKWYEIAKYTNVFQNGDCTEANYGPVNQQGQVTVLNKEIQRNTIIAVSGFARQNRDNSGKLQVSLRVPIVGVQQSGYDVLAVDYDNYALVHSCRSILGKIKIEFLWILSRKRMLSDQHTKEIQHVIQKNGLDGKTIRITQQTNCPILDDRPFQLIA